MKIAYLSHGHNVYDRRFLEKMVERGHQPHLLSYWSEEPKVEISGLTIHHYPLSFPRFRLLPAVMHLRGLLKFIRPDILHTGFLQHHGFYGALSGFHPTLSMPFASDVLVVPDESWYGRWIARFVLKRADMITCDCVAVKDKIMALTGCTAEKIVIFPRGVDLNIFRPDLRPSAIRQKLGWQNNHVLITTRNFRPVYGIEFFIEALPEVMRVHPETRVILVGSGPLEADYRSRLDQLELSGKAHFAGRVDEPTIAAYLNAADIYVTTALSDGTSASMLEAMACGLPVVVSDAPAYYEWVQNGVNGFIVRGRDVDWLSARLIELIGNRALWQEMGARNLTIARERADWESNFDVLEGIYACLVSHR